MLNLLLTFLQCYNRGKEVPAYMTHKNLHHLSLKGFLLEQVKELKNPDSTSKLNSSTVLLFCLHHLHSTDKCQVNKTENDEKKQEETLRVDLDWPWWGRSRVQCWPHAVPPPDVGTPSAASEHLAPSTCPISTHMSLLTWKTATDRYHLQYQIHFFEFTTEALQCQQCTFSEKWDEEQWLIFSWCTTAVSSF